jgi:hypothetical protein
MYHAEEMGNAYKILVGSVRGGNYIRDLSRGGKMLCFSKNHIPPFL